MMTSFLFSLIQLIVLIITSVHLVSGETLGIGGMGDIGFAYEFKIHIEAGKEECFFQVVKGGDSKAGFGIRDPYGTVVMPYAWKSDAEYEVEYVPAHGVYQFCIDNSLSRFNAKMISLYCSSYKRDEWEKIVDGFTESHGTVSNISSALQNVDKNIGTMLKMVDHSRRHKAYDFMLLESNFNYINNLSITYCCIFVFISLGQVYFLRRMFSDSSSSSSAYKPVA